MHRNSRLLTPMHCAASGGWDQILELLIEADANISTKAEDQVPDDLETTCIENWRLGST